MIMIPEHDNQPPKRASGETRSGHQGIRNILRIAADGLTRMEEEFDSLREANRKRQDDETKRKEAHGKR
jgi:hypothetical protein